MLVTTFLVALALQPITQVTCRSIGLDPTRTWRFETQGDTWRVLHWRGTDATRAVSVSLPGNATVQFTKDNVRVAARSSNGGIDVALTGPPTLARLDIYVSYELEVNVDASLTPAIDDLNTDSPMGVRCEASARP